MASPKRNANRRKFNRQPLDIDDLTSASSFSGIRDVIESHFGKPDTDPSEGGEAAVEPDPSKLQYVWEPKGVPFSVRLDADLIGRLEKESLDIFRAITNRGSEIGGILLGQVLPGWPRSVLVEDYEPVACAYTLGPSYLLSEEEREKLEEAIEKRENAGQTVVGFFRSNTRPQLVLQDDDQELFEEFFPEDYAIFLLAKPFSRKPCQGAIYVREGGKVRAEASPLEFCFSRAELEKQGALQPGVRLVSQPARLGPSSTADRGGAIPIDSVAEPKRPAAPAPKPEPPAPPAVTPKVAPEPPAPPAAETEPEIVPVVTVRVPLPPLGRRPEPPKPEPPPPPAAKVEPPKPEPPAAAQTLEQRIEERLPWLRQTTPRPAATSPSRPAFTPPSRPVAPPAESAPAAPVARPPAPPVESAAPSRPAFTPPPQAAPPVASAPPAKPEPQAGATPEPPAPPRFSARIQPRVPPSVQPRIETNLGSKAAPPTRFISPRQPLQPSRPEPKQEVTLAPPPKAEPAPPPKPQPQPDVLLRAPAPAKAEPPAPPKTEAPKAEAAAPKFTKVQPGVAPPPEPEAPPAGPSGDLESLFRKPEPKPGQQKAPSFGYKEEEESAGGKNRWLLPVGIALLIAIVGVYFLVIRPNRQSPDDKSAATEQTTERRQPITFSLRAEGSDAGLTIFWDGLAAPVATAPRGILSIRDGAATKNIDLTSDELKKGVYEYEPNTDDVLIRLELKGLPGNQPAFGGTRILGARRLGKPGK
jgi:hypothetical protein